MSASVTPLAPDLDAALRRLRLRAMRQLAPELLVTSKTQRWSPEEFLRTLLEAEISSRDASNATTDCAQNPRRVSKKAMRKSLARCTMRQSDSQLATHNSKPDQTSSTHAPQSKRTSRSPSLAPFAIHPYCGGSCVRSHPPPSARIRLTVPVMRLRRMSISLTSLFSAVVCAVITWRNVSTPPT